MENELPNMNQMHVSGHVACKYLRKQFLEKSNRKNNYTWSGKETTRYP